MDDAGDSISEWLGRLKTGELDAAQKIWSRYVEELQNVAKQRLGNSPRGMADEEDVAQSVFGSVFRGAAAGRFDNVLNRDELWWLLLTVTKRKSVDHIRRETAHKRRLRQVPCEARVGHPVATGGCQISLGELVSETPTPDSLVELNEQYRRLLEVLRNDQLREVAALRIEGYTVPEIASQVAIGARAVERKLQLIRTKWKRELLESDPVQ